MRSWKDSRLDAQPAHHPRGSSKPDRGAAGLHLSRPLSRPDRALSHRAAGKARTRRRASCGLPSGGAHRRGMTALLEVRDLHIRFPVASRLSAALSGLPKSVEVVAGISFSLATSETLALVGESGSGKTTVARAIVGLVPVNSGSIAFLGRSITELRSRALAATRRDMGMIFQDPVGSLSPRLSVRAI